MNAAVSIDEAFDICGGFGRFQKFSAVITFITMNSTAFFLYSFVFL